MYSLNYSYTSAMCGLAPIILLYVQYNVDNFSMLKNNKFILRGYPTTSISGNLSEIL